MSEKGKDSSPARERSQEAVRDHREDDHFASDIQDFRSLLHTRDREGLQAALESPDLFRLACDDPRYMDIAMQGIAVLAWDDPARASQELVRYDATKSRENPESAARRAARALMAALEWRQLEAQESLPMAEAEALREFLRLFPALGDDPELGTSLRADLQERPHFYADFFHALHSRAQILPTWIVHLEHQAPGAEPPPAEPPEHALQSLSEDQLGALSAAMADLRASLRSRAKQYLVWAAVAGVLVALPSAAGALIALLLVGASLTLGESKSYEQIVRPRLIHLAIEHGVGAKPVVSWLYRLSGKAGKVGSFDIKIENDGALDLLAALSRSASP